MKKLLFFLFAIIFSSSYAQKDSIVTYLDAKGKIVTDLSKVYLVEILTKKNDSLWLCRKVRRSGKIKSYNYFTSKDKKTRIGQFVSYHLNDSIKSLMHFNANGKGHGRFKRWFFNGQMAVNGIHQNGKKEGVWKYYHFNGKVASIEVFKNNSLIKEKYFNEKGITIDHDTTKCKPKVAYFEGGIKKFQHKINRLVRNQLDFKSNGKFHVDFIIDIKGNIRNVSFDENLPKKRETYLIKEFEKIKGWKPAIVKHRTVPFPFNMGFTISIK